jgi:ankyrin repeat protein
MDEFFKAIVDGNLRKIRRILANDPKRVSARDSVQYTPLHRAVWEGQTKITTFLLDKGADVRSKGPFGDTALHYASHPDLEPEGGARIAELLIKRGADIETRNDAGETPLFCAAMRNPEVAEVLLKHAAIFDLNSAVFLGRLDRVRELLQDDPKLKEVLFPDLLLDSAVCRHDTEMVELLLKHGVNPNRGRPPLFSAVEAALNDPEQKLDVIQILLKYGARIDFQSDGLTLLDLVGSIPNKRGEKVVKVLKKKGGQKAQRLFKSW